MCRLFGFRSVFSSKVHKSLIGAENALIHQSEEHPDGWGVTYYVAGNPHLIKTADSAFADSLFQHVFGVVSSETVIAHLRKATLGDHSIINTHPFQYGSWVFAHNGNIKDFHLCKGKLHARVADKLKKYILGQTDSELIFYLILTFLEETSGANLHTPDIPMDALVGASQQTINFITSIAGALQTDDTGPNTENFLTFLITNGQTMLAHQGGKSLYYSVHKNRCSERDSCPFFIKACENESRGGKVSHLLFSSEALQGENVWRPMQMHQIVGIDAQMNVSFHQAAPAPAPAPAKADRNKKI